MARPGREEAELEREEWGDNNLMRTTTMDKTNGLYKAVHMEVMAHCLHQRFETLKFEPETYETTDG
jgi:hypothetical protein